MRKTLAALVLLIGILVIARQLLSGSGRPGGDAPISEAPYIVARQTGLYLATGATEPVQLLEAGTVLRAAGGAAALDCRPVVLDDETAPVCHVEVALSGRWGWVAEADIAER